MKKTMITKWFRRVLAVMLVCIFAAVLPINPAAAANIPFEGDGTLEKPYIIDSAEALGQFRDLVNQGEDFAGSYFLQTGDLDLANIPNWVPIGTPETDSHFAGVYNGGGHRIHNLTVNAPTFAGLFGRLSGTVMNLGVESGNISGEHAGSIVSHSASTEAMLINCYSKASVTGIWRAGGLVDNFMGGRIIGCWSTGTVNAPVAAAICGYDADMILDCAASYPVLLADTFTGSYDCIYTVSDPQQLAQERTAEFEACSSIDISPEKQLLTSCLRGSGAKSDPYRIETADDLRLFRDLVNMGFDFSGRYIRQETDLDLSIEDNWTPIGERGKDLFFCGIYDGAGHSIANIRSYNRGATGLFGAVSGTVMNLAITSGSFEANYAAAIVCDGAGALVLNCSNNATVTGANYAGGIGCNFPGSRVVSCLNTGAVSAGEGAGGIIAIGAQKVINSYSVGISVLSENGNADVDSLSAECDAVSEAAALMNRRQYATVFQNGFLDMSLARWNSDGGFDGLRSYRFQFFASHILIAVLMLTVVAAVCVAVKINRRKMSLAPASVFAVIRDEGKCLRGSMDQRVLYVILGIFLLCLSLLASSYLIGDSAVTGAFFYDDEDAYMDFFNPMRVIYNSNYRLNGHYTAPGATYPPMARAVLWLFGGLLPSGIWEMSAFQIRSHTYGAMLYLLASSACLMCLYGIFCRMFSGGSKALMLLCLFSSPMLYLVERGNVLLFALVFSAAFVANYRSSNPVVRHLSYLCLALAAAIKIYPAALGLLVLREKNWKHTLQCLVYGLLACIGPFFLIGGVKELLLYVRNISGAVDGNAASINSLFVNYTNTVTTLFSFWDSADAGRKFASATVYPFVLLLAVCGFSSKQHWKAVLAAALITMLLPGFAHYYCAAIMILPMLCFAFEKHSRPIDYVYAVLLALVLVPLQFLCGAYGVTVDTVRQIAALSSLGLALLLIVDSAVISVKALCGKRKK